MTDSIVKVKFEEDDDGRVYSIEWAELLNEEELPLSCAALPGMKVLAPWSSQRGEKVSYALATVCDENDETGKYKAHIIMSGST